jgi:hypothetical protein
MGTMAIAIFIHVILGDSLSPGRTISKLSVINVNAGVDDVDIYTFATMGVKLVLVECAE